MTAAPILRSTALQKALALIPVRRPSPPGAFATTLAQAADSRGSRASVASAWSAASQSRLPTGLKLVAFGTLAPTDRLPFQELITVAANKYGIDPALLAALVKQESNFDPLAKSGAGAKGLTQLMDATARGLGVTDAFDPAQSLDAGARFLSGLLKQFKGNPSLALAAYNAGPGAVQQYGGIPPYQETQRYVPKVLGYVRQFRRIWADPSAMYSPPVQTS